MMLVSAEPFALKVMAAGSKRKRDIEQLLQWAFLDELPKRKTSSAEGIWDRLAQWGSLGGINPDVSQFAGGGAQRYAQFGLPHKDAEAIELAVAALGAATVDWPAHFDTIAAELGALVDINGVGAAAARPYRAGPANSGFARGHFDERTTLIDYSYIRPHHRGRLRRGLRAKLVAADAPRDVIAVASVNVAALVHTHALKKTRPSWHSEAPACHGMRARGGGFAIVGECRGRDLYTPGSYCPLTWSPSPLQIVLDRADYFLWHAALVHLAKTLDLREHEPLLPEAPATPWIDGEIVHRAFKQEPDPKTFSLRAPARPRAGPPPKKRRRFKGRRVRLDEGAKA